MNYNTLFYRLGLNKFKKIEKNYKDVVCYYDTGLSSLNVGDEIINDAGINQLKKVLSDQQFFKVSTHDGISSRGIYHSNLCDLRVLCGSNILSDNVLVGSSWNISVLDVIRMEPIIFMGVGWNKYSESSKKSAKIIYNRLFDKEYIHSVRDEYTKNKLKSIGITNVINTGCPTMWNFTPDFCKEVNKEKSDNVVFTLTDYDRNYEQDKFLIKTLQNEYKKVYFWPQGHLDKEYISSLDVENIEIIPPRLSDYDELLKNNDIDFVGTRLHGGIRALQHKKRTLIVAIDNRAIEKNKDFNLPVIHRDKLQTNLQGIINNDIICDIKIPLENINKWLNQFK
ncbi:polysaccharide pyruvyl transferase family protein [Photobacterium damselae]|uniref:polysaccharide pyruvyl transferase family protein n=1 Tax=Photobacterium damselae TaxID=38293 RepID=UPI002542B421